MIQKEVEKSVKMAKRKLERKLAKNAKKNPKAFYSYIKKKRSNRVTVGPLKNKEGKLVTEDQEMVELLNNHYCSVFTVEEVAEMPAVEQLYQGEEPLTTTEFVADNVKEKLSKLKPSAAPGPDKVWTRVLHSLAAELASPLAIIYTRLLGEGSVPAVWRSSNVCPIYKNLSFIIS